MTTKIKTYLEKKYPDAKIWDSLDKDFIHVRIVLCANSKVDGVSVPITNTMKFHIDTIKLEMIDIINKRFFNVDSSLILKNYNFLKNK